MADAKDTERKGETRDGRRETREEKRGKIEGVKWIEEKKVEVKFDGKE